MDYFETSNLAEAAYLTCLGHHLTGQSMQGSKMIFQFSNTEKVRVDAQSFFYGAKVSANEYFECIKKLKSLIWSMKESS